MLFKFDHVTREACIDDTLVLGEIVSLNHLLGWELAVSHLNWNEITENALLVLELVSVAELESLLELVLRLREIVVEHLVASSVVMNTNMPRFGKSVDLTLLGSIDETEVTLAELVLAQGKLNS